MSKRKGKLFIISGPSGVGKDSVIEKAKEFGLSFGRVITTTTRKPRKGEEEGKPYHFVNKQQFQKLIKEKQLLEWAQVYDHYYGSTRKEVEEALRVNKVIVLKVDPQGARTIKKLMPEAKVIFIIPPSLEALSKRLKSRRTDSEAVIKKRLLSAKKEMDRLKEWEFIVVNEEGKLKKAAREVKKIITSSSKKKLWCRILFGFLSLLVIVGYLLLFGIIHPQTKQFVQEILKDITTPLAISIRIHQSKEILKFLPDSTSLAYLINPLESENIKTLSLLTTNNKNLDYPLFQEALFFYQKDNVRGGVIFQLENPVLQNWENFQQTIKYIWATKYPFQQTKILPDGTPALELLPQPEKVAEETVEYKGEVVLLLTSKEVSLAYARIGSFAVLTNYLFPSTSPSTIYRIIDAYQDINQRIDLRNFTRCLEENPFKLAFFEANIDKNPTILLEDPLFGLIFGQHKPKNDRCI